MAFYALFAAIGALAAAAVAAAGGSVVFQVVAFAVVSLGGLAGARRPLMRSMGMGRFRSKASGVHGMVGENAVVVLPVGNGSTAGSVRLRGEDWPAITDDATRFDVGTVVVVEDVRRAKLVVGASPDVEHVMLGTEAPHFDLPDIAAPGTDRADGHATGLEDATVDPIDPTETRISDRPEDEK